MTAYHDGEWGTPIHDDHRLFEYLMLDGFQAGLSWRTILYKREAFRAAFDRFDPRKVAGYGAAERRRLLRDSGIVRNRQKIDAATRNARGVLDLQREFGSFDRYLWSFTGRKTLRLRGVRRFEDLPTTSPEAESLSADLRRRGFSFVGPTIVYAFMQAVGMVDDHLIGCFKYRRRSQ
jgi:DNA-3-methyladenine glycosylase I